MQLGEPVVQAALDAGCHYFDTTGETDWMLFLQKEYGAAFERKELALCPANSYMWTEGAIAAEIALETPGIDSLDLMYYGDAQISVASTMSFLRMCTKPMYYLKNGELVQWPWAQAYDVAVPGVHRVLKGMPWGGAGEPVWYHGDARVKNCQVLFALGNQEMMMSVLGILQQFEKDYRHLDAAAQEQVTNTIGQQVTQVEPRARRQSCIVGWCRVRRVATRSRSASSCAVVVPTHRPAYLQPRRHNVCWASNSRRWALARVRAS